MTKQDLISILNTYPDNTTIVIGLPVEGTDEMEILQMEIDYFEQYTTAVISPQIDQAPSVKDGTSVVYRKS